MNADYVSRGVQTLTANLGLPQVNQNEAFDDPVLDAVNSNAAILDNAVVVVPVPASSTAAGKPNQIAYSAGFLYVCVAPNTWVRLALTTF
jgi:hypothetical protein